jgi:photosystem II stability/assembly factor-like uncharacterized protein
VSVFGVGALAIDPSAPATLYAGTYASNDLTLDGGVFKSTNGGQSWTAVSAGLTIPSVLALAIDPSVPETLYAGTDGDGVFETANGGRSWTDFNAGLTNTRVRALAIDPSASAVIYAGTDGGVFDFEFPASRLEILPSGGQRTPRQVGSRR